MVIRLRSLSNGSSLTTWFELVIDSRDTPPFAESVRSAPSVGSPCTRQPSLGLLERRVVAEGDGREQIAQRPVGGVDALVDRVEDRAAGVVAGAGHLVARAARVDHAYGHLVLRERAGLVGADDGRGAERLDRGELAHDGAALGHALHAEGERDRRDGREPLGDGGDREAHGLEEELVPRPPALHVPAQEEQPREPQAGPEDALAECLELLLEGRRAVARAVDQLGELAELRVHGGRHDHRAPASADDARPDEEHRRAVPEGRVVRDGGARILLHRHALARQRALLGGEVRRLEQARVGRHGVARFELEHVARRRRTTR